MLWSFLFSLLAGALTIPCQPLVRAGVRRIDDADLKLDAMELRILTFGLLLLVAAALTAIIGADSSAYMAVAGGLIGYFAYEFVLRLRAEGRMSADDDNGGVYSSGYDAVPGQTSGHLRDGGAGVRRTAPSRTEIDDPSVLYSESPGTGGTASLAAGDDPRTARLRAVTQTMRKGGGPGVEDDRR
ncbi:hypothetical protein [Tropicimonas sp. IMCC34043]|uniref:hypothetical protein n=1 Tax=Tropicimonas sp. IMCC34043 TaxID=2248760 RepID=UPI000E24181F|nr:hypothetical protein [Tropicimonas sp. IMCC34043]